MSENRYKDLRDVRYKNGDLSQVEAARLIGIAPNNYGRIESKAIHGTVRTWTRIQEVFGLTDAETWRLMAHK